MHQTHGAGTVVHLGRIVHIKDNPAKFSTPTDALQSWDNGALAFDQDGTITFSGEAAEARRRFAGAQVVDHGEKFIFPGFVDAHVHFPQLDVIGSYGEDLIGWLRRYTYPAEAAYADLGIARDGAYRFVTELVDNGTTTAACYSSSHLSATDQLLTEGLTRGLRLVAGKVSMDCHAPVSLLCNTADEAKTLKMLIGKWHGRDDRLSIAITPRFAPSCSLRLLRDLGELAGQHPEIAVQTHYAESDSEIALVKELFPTSQDYLAVYEESGLIGPKTLLAHGLLASDDECRRIARAGATIIHCPTSNTFLGSGLLSLRRLQRFGVKCALGSDVGGGTGFSMWRTMAEAYKVQRLLGEDLHPAEALFLATLAGADALGLAEKIGNFAAGKQADFQVLDLVECRLMARRLGKCESSEAVVFALMFLADDRIVDSVYVKGKKVSLV